MSSKIAISFFLFFCTACATIKNKSFAFNFVNAYTPSTDIEAALLKDTVEWKYQRSASAYASNGDYKNALQHWDLGFSPRIVDYSQKQIDSINHKYSSINAANYIVEKAKTNQIVIINEAHHNSLHRFFTRSLLKGLYDAGYRNLGLETLGNGSFLDTNLNSRKYPIQTSGHYTKDPQFGNMVREALQLGYYVFAYETTTDANGKQREIDQANYISAHIKDKPNEKFLIHCGFDHVYEGEMGSWVKAMAGRVEEFTSINPLTINQVVYCEKSKSEYSHPMLKATQVKESSILLDKENAPLNYSRGNASTDLAVFHPYTDFKDNRPNWLFNKKNKAVPINLSLFKYDFPVMVLAYKKGEDISKAIPYDIVEVLRQSDKCVMALEKGDYEIVVTNGSKSIQFKEVVK